VISTIIEEWLPVAGHPMYEVSNLGRVRSNSRAFRNKKNNIMKLTPNQKGYLKIQLMDSSERGKRYSVHALVLTTFLRPKKHGEECDHIDNNKTNNCISNLQWLSRSENIAKKNQQNPLYGERHPRAKLNATAAEEIRKTKSDAKGTRWGAASLARKFGVSRRTIFNVINGTHWKERAAIAQGEKA